MLYHYLSFNMTGCYFVNDYIFECCIEAETAEKALLWGHMVIRHYDENVARLRPDKEALSEFEILEFASVEKSDFSEELLESKWRCNDGEYPDFTIKLKKLEPDEVTRRPRMSREERRQRSLERRETGAKTSENIGLNDDK